jgi:glycosyltransferase involved in cell wall biosynthesis
VVHKNQRLSITKVSLRPGHALLGQDPRHEEFSARRKQSGLAGTRDQLMLKIVFYCESSVFGGHEMSALAAHRAIAELEVGLEIVWMVSKGNPRLIEALEEQSAVYIALDINPQFEVRRNPVSAIKKLHRCLRLLRHISPSLVVIIQGGIMGSYDGVFVALLAGVRFCSYIPMAHRSTELASYRYPRLWDAFRSIFYRLIPRYITSDELQAINISRENSAARVTVVENYIFRPISDADSRTSAKQRLNLPAEAVVLGVVGRVSFIQKAQDWLLFSLQNDSFLKDKVVIFVGDGPDAQRLSRLIQSSPQRDRLRLLDWQANMDQIYKVLDLLLIPSRTEGVPFVMLEALARHIPVVGTDRDGMKTWLPAEWRFRFGDSKGMRTAVESALNAAPAGAWRRIETKLAIATDRQRFAKDFASAIKAYCIK